MAKELGEQVITAKEYKGYINSDNEDVSFDKEIKESIRQEVKKFNKTHKRIFDKKEIEKLNADGEKLFDKMLSIAGLSDISDKQKKYMKSKAEENTERKCMQAMEALVHNLNTMHSRAGKSVA